LNSGALKTETINLSRFYFVIEAGFVFASQQREDKNGMSGAKLFYREARPMVRKLTGPFDLAPAGSRRTRPASEQENTASWAIGLCR
jgi:hypothetical protein